MLALSRPDWQITALEVQISQYLLARHNVEQSGVKVTLLLADLRKSIHSGNNNRYDLIYANPPYFQIGTARISPSLPRAISRYELLCDMDNLLSVVNNNLTPEGEAYILYPDFRLPDLHRKAGRYGLEILKEIGKKNKSSKNREEIEDNERGSKSWTVSILGRR
jgi:tRNA1Val (adenine37-N6)-methyltransferase